MRRITAPLWIIKIILRKIERLKNLLGSLNYTEKEKKI